MTTPIEHKEAWQWSYKRDAAALRAEAAVWAGVERAKGGTCTTYDLLVEYEAHCRRQEQRGRVPAGFCSWCHRKLNPAMAAENRPETPMLPRVKTRQCVQA